MALFVSLDVYGEEESDAKDPSSWRVPCLTEFMRICPLRKLSTITLSDKLYLYCLTFPHFRAIKKIISLFQATYSAPLQTVPPSFTASWKRSQSSVALLLNSKRGRDEELYAVCFSGKQCELWKTTEKKVDHGLSYELAS